ncbi:unnamed protein product [Chondrus crispus]|uniref:BAH domain-containing protein n=1 Tax=Chondrus crispus TaxID=2769 RepID=R7Q942_CHOCR|nr:unnamed protein product [Chondrus crispus]CDF35032.1 unnamed protein product [Chondrus crispus]|eukprot:XP_005714851.1 unnamed protein product [Chondrus crispus]
MDFLGEQWEWSWTSHGQKKHLGRVFHRKIQARRLSDDLVRTYKIGDTVVMKGENDDTWTAQIVELFEATEDDEELREVLQMDLRKINNVQGYELMRVTLRWFYNSSDMNKHTLRSSSCPNHIKHEIYFSDHVEKEGYNDITVIEGKAWLVSSKLEREEFLQNPPEGYERDMDQVRIVRCFVNSLSPDLAVRELDTGELAHLLKNPTDEKDLFETSRQRMRRLIHSDGSIIRPPSKGTGAKPPRRKRSRSIRKPIEIEDDEFDPKEKKDATDAQEPARANKMPGKSGENTDQERRRKKQVIDIEDDDSDGKVEPSVDPARLHSLQQANEEVLDLVASLNQNALSGTELAGVQRDSQVDGASKGEKRFARRPASDEAGKIQRAPKRNRTDDKEVLMISGKKAKVSSIGKTSAKAGASSRRAGGEKQVTAGDDIDWWEETQKALQRLEKEFNSMPSASQELFRNHAEIAFDLAVAKVTERGLFGKLDTKNEQLSAISREILNDLKKVMVEEARGGVGGLRELGDGTVVLDPSD